MTSKVSFTIRPPTTSSGSSMNSESNPRKFTQRSTTFIPHAADSSDEDEEEDAIEAVTAFDQSGAQRLHEKPKPSGPLVIPALANRDWRAIARLRRQNKFIPDGAAVMTGTDGSQGGLGTRDSINSAPQASGLVMRKKDDARGDIEEDSVKAEYQEVSTETVERLEDSEDERARRALLAGLAGGEVDGITIDAIPVSGEHYSSPANETDAYKQDVVTRPDSATFADYERVPVSQFGAALLRGMGWKEGTAASRTRPGLVEPWLPPSRPALLGIGAKERSQEDIPSTGNGNIVSKRPEKRYVPVVKVQREGSELPPPSRSRSRSPRSRTVSRVPSSKSASPYSGDHNADRRRRPGNRDSGRDEPSHSRSGRDSDRDLGRDRGRERGDKERRKDHRQDRERDERSRKEKDYKRDEKDRYSRDRGDRY